MASKHIVVWPKVRVLADGESLVLAKGTLVPKGVSPVDLDNLTSFGAIAGVVDTLPEVAPPIAPTSNDPGALVDDEGAAPYDPGAKGETIDKVLEYVGDDPERAAAVLELEEAGQNRSTLVEQLEAIVSSES